MNDRQYSPSVRAAMERNAAHAQIGRARRDDKDVPPLSSQAADCSGTNSRGRLRLPPGFPSVAQTHAEMVAAFKERYYSEDLKVRSGVSGTALWAAQRQNVPSDTVDEALVRIDKLAERKARYRRATGDTAHQPEANDPRIRFSFKLRKSLIERIKQLASVRGSSVTACVAFLLESGLILCDERTKRYEALVLNQLHAEAAEFGESDRAHPFRVEVDRYVDPESPALQIDLASKYPA